MMKFQTLALSTLTLVASACAAKIETPQLHHLESQIFEDEVSDISPPQSASDLSASDLSASDLSASDLSASDLSASDLSASDSPADATPPPPTRFPLNPFPKPLEPSQCSQFASQGKVDCFNVCAVGALFKCDDEFGAVALPSEKIGIDSTELKEGHSIRGALSKGVIQGLRMENLAYRAYGQELLATGTSRGSAYFTTQVSFPLIVVSGSALDHQGLRAKSKELLLTDSNTRIKLTLLSTAQFASVDGDDAASEKLKVSVQDANLNTSLKYYLNCESSKTPGEVFSSAPNLRFEAPSCALKLQPVFQVAGEPQGFHAYPFDFLTGKSWVPQFSADQELLQPNDKTSFCGGNRHTQELKLRLTLPKAIEFRSLVKTQSGTCSEGSTFIADNYYSKAGFCTDKRYAKGFDEFLYSRILPTLLDQIRENGLYESSYRETHPLWTMRKSENGSWEINPRRTGEIIRNSLLPSYLGDCL